MWRNRKMSRQGVPLCASPSARPPLRGVPLCARLNLRVERQGTRQGTLETGFAQFFAAPLRYSNSAAVHLPSSVQHQVPPPPPHPARPPHGDLASFKRPASGEKGGQRGARHHWRLCSRCGYLPLGNTCSLRWLSTLFLPRRIRHAPVILTCCLSAPLPAVPLGHVAGI